MKTLYITYDGLTDPLGRSQVLPYILGLESRGVEFVILSCDKPDKYQANQETVKTLLKGKHIKWVSEVYHHSYSVLSAIDNQKRLYKKAVELMNLYHFDIVHCRSYIPAEIGFRLKKKYDCRWIFDMRGFFPDERVDGQVWNLKNPIYNYIYHYFKKKEYQYFKNADYTISLTNAGANEIRKMAGLENTPIKVIPCCVDLAFFKSENITITAQSQMKQKLSISEGALIYAYLGSMGTWYLPEDMFDFAQCYLQRYPQAIFLLITQDDPKKIRQWASVRHIPETSYRIYSAKREDVPLLLSLCEFSIFFIKSSFSKKASSPTKMGEILSMGLPCVCNSGVGDVSEIVQDTNCGVLLENLTKSDYMEAIDRLNMLNYPADHYRQAAFKYYDLEAGILAYDSVYKMIMQK